MMLFKACPHCLHGDLIVEREHEHLVATCIQCGYAGELRSVYPQPRPLPQLALLPERRQQVHAA